MITLKVVQLMNKDSNSLVDDPTERTKRFVLEFEKPYKCNKCDERFRKKKYLREHKADVHSY
jgi:hypothetical protein